MAMVRTLIVALALGLLAPLAPADDVKSDKPIEKRETNKDNPLDKEFLTTIAQRGNNCENCLVVVEKLTSSDKVKEFAKAVKKDHDDLQKDLAKTIKDKKLAIVATPDKDSVAKINELRKKDKDEMNKDFLTYFIEGHEKTLKMAENQKENGKDKDVTALAEKMIPGLKDHLKKAKALQKDLK
jgi:putative membrane protein